MQLILQYELKEFDWHQTLHRNHKRSLERGDRLSEFFSILLSHLQKLSSAIDADKQLKLLQEMEENLQVLAITQDYRNIVGAKEVTYWVKWKLAGKGHLRNQLVMP